MFKINPNKEKSPETQDTVSMPTEQVVEMYNLLYSINVHGEAVKVIGYVLQKFEQYLDPKQSKVN